MDKGSIVNGGHGKEETKEIEETELKQMKELAKLKYIWIVWEQFAGGDKSQKGLVEKEYMDNMQVIGEFGDLITFWQYWNSIPHANPADCFAYYHDDMQTSVHAQ
jgi:hypothetical protein